MSSAGTFSPTPGALANRDDIPTRYTWDLTAICRDWDDWTASYRQLESAVESFRTLQGTLANGPESLLAAYRAMDEMGALSYRVWYFASLHYDEDQRDNTINGRRQQVQILFARYAAARSSCRRFVSSSAR